MNNFDRLKASYIGFKGSAFHMAREDEEAYKLYKALSPDDALLSEWDREIVEDLFSKLWEDPDHVWTRHSQIVEFLDRRHVDLDHYVSRLLDEMDKMDELDKKSKIIIIETMSGHNSKPENGGVHLICSFTQHEARMVEVMNKLKKFYCDEFDDLKQRGWDDMNGRFLRAVADYVSAYRRYGKLKLSTL